MSVRKSVEHFAALGVLPGESSSEAEIVRSQELLERIEKPVSNEEAAVLLTCFGPDDCYGLAWMLLHLVESAPGGIRCLRLLRRPRIRGSGGYGRDRIGESMRARD